MSCTNKTPNINKTFVIESSNEEIVSVCDMFYVNNIRVCTGDTINFIDKLVTPAIDAALMLSGGTDLIDIISGQDTFITGFTYSNDNILTISNNFGINFSVDISEMSGVTYNGNLEPSLDLTNSVGTPVKRFRDINTFSGNTTIWVVEQVTKTPNLDLGFDDNNNNRIITANNSIIEDDTLIGGTY